MWSGGLLLVCIALCMHGSHAQDDIRLVGGVFGDFMGRVEVLYNGTWGTICDTFWSFSDSKVACVMLGYRAAVCQTRRSSFGSGSATSPIWMDRMRCDGDELALEDCDFSGWGEVSRLCTHSRDAGVFCAADDVVDPPQELRLLRSSTTTLIVEWQSPTIPRGATAMRFRVEYRPTDTEFPRVRYVYTSVRNLRSSYNLTLTTLTRDTQYTIRVRAEVRYSTCFSYLYGNYSNTLNTSTNATVASSALQIRLVPPEEGFPFMGRLEVFYSNQWGTVCDDFFSTREANVVCGMLNYTRSLCTVSSARLGQGTGPIWMDDVRCLSGQEILDECAFDGWGVHNCGHGEDVGVICRPDDFPGQVMNVTVVRVAATSITIRWEPLQLPRLTTTRYRIQYTLPGSRFPRSLIVSSSINEYTISRLQFGANYTITVRAEVRFTYCFVYLYGEYSTPVNATTMETAPSGPPTSFHIIVLNSTAIELQWELPLVTFRNGIIRGFRAFVQQPPETTEMMINIRNNNTLAYILSGLRASTAYACSILAYTVADGPRSIHLTVVTRSSDFVPFIVRFGINGNGLDRVVRFTFNRGIQVHCGSGLMNVSFDWFFANGTKVGIQNRYIREGHFTNGTAVLEIGNGRRLNYCDAGIYTCVARTPSGGVHSRNFTLAINTVPPQPSRPFQIRVHSTSITIGWEELDCDGGHTLIGFNIEYSDEPSASPFRRRNFYIRNIDASSRNYTIRDLEADNEYSFRIQAINADFRVTSYSPPLTITTLPPSPTAPQGVRVRIVTPSVVVVSWRASVLPTEQQNIHIIHYTVYGIPIAVFNRQKRQVPTDLPGTIKLVFPATTTEANITLPRQSVTYQFQVSASSFVTGQENEGTLSTITPESTIYIPPQGLPVPQSVRAVIFTNSSITLMWDYPPPPVEPIREFRVSYTATVDGRSRGGTLIRFEEERVITTPFNRVTISPLTPETLYRILVSAITERGEGEEILTHARTMPATGDRFAFIHIRIGPIQDCLEWHDEDAPNRITSIQSYLLLALNSRCNCNLLPAHITNEELSCRGGLTNQIVYRARILGTESYSATGLVDLLQSWVDTGHASVNVGNSRLEIDPTCRVFLDSLSAPDCPPPTPTTPTTTKMSTPSTDTPQPTETLKTTESSGSPTVTQPTFQTGGTSPQSTPLPSTEPRVSDTGSDSISGGAIGGIVVGVVVAVLLVVLIVLLVVFILRSVKGKQPMSIFRNTTEDKTPFADIGDAASARDSGVYDSDTGTKEKPTTEL